MPASSAHTPRRRLGLAGAVLRIQPDSRLARLAADGLEPAFEELVRRYRPALIAYSAAVVGRDRADDVVQEVLARAHGEISAKPEIDTRGWLFRAVRNASLNDLRDNRKHHHAQLDEGMNGVERPDDVLERRQRLGTVIAALAELPASQRDALVKHELEGRSHAEIAGSLSVSVGAVRQLIYRARLTLRDGLGSLVPLPVIRSLVQAPGSAETAGAGLAAAASGAGGVKIMAVLAVAGGTLFAGAALDHERSDRPAGSAAVAAKVGDDGAPGGVSGGSGPAGSKRGVAGRDPRLGRSGDGGQTGATPGGGATGEGPDEGEHGTVREPGDGGEHHGSDEADGGGTDGGPETGGGEEHGGDPSAGDGGDGDGGAVGEEPGDGPTGGGGDGSSEPPEPH